MTAMKQMRYSIVVAAFLASACGDSPAGPSRTFTANLALANGPTLTACGDIRCTYTVSVINNGPDCATGVGVGILLRVPEPPGRFNALAIGVSAPGLVRSGQVVTLTGNDWPTTADLPNVTVSGAGAACQ